MWVAMGEQNFYQLARSESLNFNFLGPPTRVLLCAANLTIISEALMCGNPHALMFCQFCLFWLITSIGLIHLKGCLPMPRMLAALPAVIPTPGHQIKIHTVMYKVVTATIPMPPGMHGITLWLLTVYGNFLKHTCMWGKELCTRTHSSWG